jgi:PGF-CTERM protein
MVRPALAVSVFGVIALLLVTGGVAAQEAGPGAGEQAVEAEQSTPAVQELGTVQVTVVDRSGGGIGGIEVTASWDGGEVTESTRTNGQALIDVPVDEEIEFTVSDPDGEYVRNHQPVELSDVAGEEVTIEMAEPGDVELSVVDTDGNPVEGVELTLSHVNDFRTVERVTTDADGTVTVSGIERRSYDVEAVRPGYNAAETNFTLAGSAATQTLEIESNRVNVDFTVTDDHFEPAVPLEDAIIDIAGFGTLPPTFPDGTQNQDLPVNDEYEITVDKEGYDPVEATLEVGEEPTSLNVSIQRSPAITIDQLQDAVVVDQPTLVTITNAYGEPVSGASVSLNDESVGRTDDKGQIVFNVTAAGENTLTASYEGLTASGTIDGVDPDAEPSGGSDDGETDGDDGMESEADGDDGTEGDDGGSSDGNGSGFGVLAAVVALLGVALLARRR